jgi:hypothetical protein
LGGWQLLLQSKNAAPIVTFTSLTPNQPSNPVYLDLMEANNPTEDPAYRDVRTELRARLEAWMQATRGRFPSGVLPQLNG